MSQLLGNHRWFSTREDESGQAGGMATPYTYIRPRRAGKCTHQSRGVGGGAELYHEKRKETEVYNTLYSVYKVHFIYTKGTDASKRRVY